MALITSKAQTTVPAPVRTALHLKEGDELVYSIEQDRVILTKADRGSAEDPFACFDEWSSEADRRAYADFEVRDIVKVPFPHTNRPIRQRRPALVLAAGVLQTRPGLFWLAMITSATYYGWPGDVVISDLESAGLPAPSIVRPAKIATIDGQDAERLGTLAVNDWEAVRHYLRERLGDLD